MKPIKNFITYKEAQERYRCGRRKIQKAVNDGIIVAYRPADKVLLVLESADAWFESTIVKPRVRIGRPRRGAVRR